MPNPLIEELKKQISEFHHEPKAEAIGTVLEVGDGVARVSGLSGVMVSEMIEFENGAFGVALNLEEGEAGVMLLGETGDIKEGTIAKSTGRILSVPVSDTVIGRVVNAPGRPSTGRGKSKLPNTIRSRRSLRASLPASQSISRCRRESRPSMH